MKEFLNIDELSEYLSMKRSTLYSMVESGELPHYRIGRLIRFKQDEVVKWMESHRREGVNLDKKVKGILKGINRPIADINHLVKKSIEEVKGNRYTPHHGRPDQDKAKKEVEHGTLS